MSMKRRRAARIRHRRYGRAQCQRFPQTESAVARRRITKAAAVAAARPAPARACSRTAHCKPVRNVVPRGISASLPASRSALPPPFENERSRPSHAIVPTAAFCLLDTAMRCCRVRIAQFCQPFKWNQEMENRSHSPTMSSRIKIMSVDRLFRRISINAIQSVNDNVRIIF